MHWDRIGGGIVGIVIEASVFLLPYSSTISVYGTSTDTLYNIFRFFYSSLGAITSIPIGTLTLIAVFYLVGTILIILAGVLGTLQLLSGALGVIGISLTAIGSVLTPGYTPYTINFGIAFPLILALSLTQLGMWLYLRRKHNQKN
ncbi:MAG: hypothetical protein OK452_11015 [Thaumarchaeota archaeon]|nr:hypothetical protein [Nitrososphaerota archaeon]